MLWQCCIVLYFILFQDWLVCHLELGAEVQTHTNSSIVTKTLREENFIFCFIILFINMWNQGTSGFAGVSLCQSWHEYIVLTYYRKCLTYSAQIYHFKVLSESLCNLHVPYPAVNANFFQWAAQTSALYAPMWVMRECRVQHIIIPLSLRVNSLSGHSPSLAFPLGVWPRLRRSQQRCCMSSDSDLNLGKGETYCVLMWLHQCYI